MRLLGSWQAFACWISLLFLVSPGLTRAHPLNDSSYSFYDGDNDKASIQRRADDFYLRILPLGASITYGEKSSQGAGYRRFLRDKLRYDGWKVNMVGSRTSGGMSDSDNEGWPGYRVDQVLNRAQVVIPSLKPNVVLINAGTNDATQDYFIDTIEQRMRSMIDYIFRTVPNTVVVLSTLVPNLLNQANVDIINAKYWRLAGDLQRANRHIVVADMDWLTLADLADHTHPNDNGYKKMAASWAKAIAFAEDHGWLQAPDSNVNFEDEGGGGQTCDKVIGSGNLDDRGKTQVLKALSPRIIDDGKYTHASVSMGRIHTGFYVEPHDVWFAQLVNAEGADRGSERDDWIFSDGTGIHMRVNNGNGVFGNKVTINVKRTCAVNGTRWGDVNNDGLDDFICISPNGAMHVSINVGGNPPQFSDVGLYKNAITGYSLTNVRLGDIDGDGRLDYCVVAGNGDIYCWRNGGQGDMAEYWQDFGGGSPVFTSKGMGSIDGVRLVDINGDFRADWLWMDENGRVTTYINQRNADKGMIPYWDSVGVTHQGMGEPSRKHIRFARLYDSGRADYVYVKCLTFANNRCDYEVLAWKNTGSGGKHQKGDGAYWCDMDGNGNDEYVFIDHLGRITIFRNVNTPPATNYESWSDKGIVLETGLDRKSLHLADWNGDGKCDVIAVTKATGALDVWYTSFNAATNTFSFSAKTRVVQSGCTQGWGVGRYDLGTRFADIDGDGRADYMCLEKNGRTTGWLNKPGGLVWRNQIKFSAGKDRANHRWADVNGDGLEDFLWIDKFTGNTDVWYNMGPRDISGSTFWWKHQGTLYLGSTSGPNLHFPNLGGVGRADMTEVNPKSALGWTWFNSCPGGDDGPVTNPGLPMSEAPDPPSLPGDEEEPCEGDECEPQEPDPMLDQCMDQPDIFFSPMCVGHEEGGEPFCEAQWGNGYIIKGIELWGNAAVIRGMRFTYSNDQQSQIYGREDYNYQAISWDPFQVRVTELALVNAADQVGLGRVRLRLSDGRYWDEGAWTGNNIAYFQFVGAGIIMAATGKHGFDIDCLAFRFLISPIDHVMMSRMVFDDSLDEWNEQRRGMESVSLSTAWFVNNNTVPQSFFHEVKATKQKTREFSKSQTFAGGVSDTIKVEFDAQLPFLGASKLGNELNGHWETANVTGSTESSSENIEIRDRMAGDIAPRKAVRCETIAMSGLFDGAFTTTVTVWLKNEKEFTYSSRGRFKGLSWTESVTQCAIYELDDAPRGRDPSGGTLVGVESEGGPQEGVFVLSDS